MGPSFCWGENWAANVSWEAGLLPGQQSISATNLVAWPFPPLDPAINVLCWERAAQGAICHFGLKSDTLTWRKKWQHNCPQWWNAFLLCWPAGVIRNSLLAFYLLAGSVCVCCVYVWESVCVRARLGYFLRELCLNLIEFSNIARSQGDDFTVIGSTGQKVHFESQKSSRLVK